MLNVTYILMCFYTGTEKKKSFILHLEKWVEREKILIFMVKRLFMYILNL